VSARRTLTADPAPAQDNRSAPTLELRDVGATYGRGEQAISGIDLRVSPGEIVGLLGANGAGKSTTLRAISGVLRTTGDVLLDGEPLWGPPERRSRLGVAHVPEGRQVFGMSVLDNLLLGRQTVPRGARDPAVLDNVLDVFPELGALLARNGSSLSGGEQQMVAIGRALMAQPRLVLLDEPTMGLAPVVVGRLEHVLTSISAQSIAVLVAEENLGFAAAVAPTCHVLRSGRPAWQGPTRQVLDDPSIRTLFLG
jgi:branched-chain amino acid transport system ATP-binding protein